MGPSQSHLQRHCSLNPLGSYYTEISLFLNKPCSFPTQVLSHFLPLKSLLYLTYSAYMPNILLTVGSLHRIQNIPFTSDYMSSFLPTHLQIRPQLLNMMKRPMWLSSTHHFPLVHSAPPTLAFVVPWRSQIRPLKLTVLLVPWGLYQVLFLATMEVLGQISQNSLDLPSSHSLFHHYSLTSLTACGPFQMCPKSTGYTSPSKSPMDTVATLRMLTHSLICPFLKPFFLFMSRL